MTSKSIRTLNLGAAAVAVALTGGFASTAYAGAGDKCCDLLEETQRQNLLLQAENDELKAKAAAPAEEKGDGLYLPGDFTFNTTIATDYSFRGISQTGNGPAIQGGIDWAHDSGFYIGTWASNLNFAGGMELDLYGGYGFSAGGFDFDLGAVYLFYPNDGTDNNPGTIKHTDYLELVASVGYDFDVASTNLGVVYSPDYFGESGDYFYPNFSVSVPLMPYFSLDGNIGYNFIDDNVAWGTDDYLDYGIAGNLTLNDTVTLSVGWYGTDLNSDAECFGDERLCEGRVIASIGASL